MNLYFRLLIILLKALLPARKALQVTDDCRTDFRVLPNDLDLNLYMNNGRYLTIMDLGRFDFMRQTGMLGPAIKNRWFPTLGATQMIYRRPLGIFQKYTMITRAEAWDEKWFVLSQRFESCGQIVAYGFIRGLFKGPNGLVPTHEVLKLTSASSDQKMPTPPQPGEELRAWLAAVEIMSSRRQRTDIGATRPGFPD